MRSSAFIGRVGALALALGIGAAMTGGTGLAHADNTGHHHDRGSSNNSDSSSRSGSTGSGSTGSGSTGSGSTGATGSTGNAGASGKTGTSGEPGNTAKSADNSKPAGGSRLGERLRAATGIKPSADPKISTAGTEGAAGQVPSITRTLNAAAGDAPAANHPTSPAAASDTRTRGIAGVVDRLTAARTASAASAPAIDTVSSTGTPTATGTGSTTGESSARTTNRRSLPAEAITRLATSAIAVSPGRAADLPALSRAALNRTALTSATLTNAGGSVDAQAAPFRRALAELGDRALSDTPAPVQAFATQAASQSLADTALAGPDAPAVKPGTAATLMSSLMVAAGLSPLAGGGPAAPNQSPLAWALAAWTRKETDKDIDADGVELKSATDGESAGTGAEPNARPQALAAAAVTQTDSSTVYQANPGQAPAPIISGPMNSTQVGWTTGPNTNTMQNWYVGGTDLGITWVSGYTDPATGKPIVYSIFGDTYNTAGTPNETNGWRDNVLLRSIDTNLTNGIQYNDAMISPGGIYNNNNWWNPTTGPAVTDNPDGNRAGATQIIPETEIARIDKLQKSSTFTLIPTAAIAVPVARDTNGNPVVGTDGQPVMRQYATVMSIKEWGNAGSWTTNWSALAHSDDGGKTWTIDDKSVRPSTGGNANFQQNAMTYGDPSDPNSYIGGDKTGERYVYVYGTPAGRQGSAYVARVPESQIADQTKYQYFAGDNGGSTGNWVQGDPSKAVAVIGTDGATGTIFPTTGILGTILKPLVSFLKFVYPAGFKPGGIFSTGGTGGNVSEMSVQYNEYLDKYVVMYTDGGNNVVMRVSDTPQGAWSNSVVVQGNDGVLPNTSMYAPMIHPLSGTGLLTDSNGSPENPSKLYYNLSQWNNPGSNNNYNPRMMQTDLSKLTISYA